MFPTLMQKKKVQKLKNLNIIKQILI